MALKLRLRLPKFWLPPFFMPGEEKIFELMGQFLHHIVESVNQLDKAVSCISKGTSAQNAAEMKKAVAKVSEHEVKADEVRRELEKTLYEERFFDKEEKIDLIEKLDDIADFAEIAANTLLYRELPLPPEMCSLACEMTTATKRCVVALRHAIMSLYSDFSKTLKYADMCEEERDKVRAAYSKLMHKLFNSNVSALYAMLVRDLTYRISRTADAAEEASDWTRFLAAKYT